MPMPQIRKPLPEVNEEFSIPVNGNSNKLRVYDNKVYSGMPVGGKHYWNYTDAKWIEQKVRPDLWNVQFTSVKRRVDPAPEGSGVPNGTKYHWYLIGSQVVEKLDKDSYDTVFNAVKFRIGHKRPYWKGFSYEYPDQLSEKARIILALEETLNNLKGEQP